MVPPELAALASVVAGCACDHGDGFFFSVKAAVGAKGCQKIIEGFFYRGFFFSPPGLGDEFAEGSLGGWFLDFLRLGAAG